MPNVIQHKRSSTASAVPLVGDLALGELSINSHEGKLYLKKDNGAESIVEVGAVGGNIDGGGANSVYLASQLIDGGSASG